MPITSPTSGCAPNTRRGSSAPGALTRPVGGADTNKATERAPWPGSHPPDPTTPKSHLATDPLNIDTIFPNVGHHLKVSSSFGRLSTSSDHWRATGAAKIGATTTNPKKSPSQLRLFFTPELI